MKITPEILAVVAKQYPLTFDKERDAILTFIIKAGVELDWILDIVHFKLHPIDGGDRPTIMPTIGRGLELMSVFSRVDYASIVMGNNGGVDYPDLCNVYVESAQCQYSGEDLTDDQLDTLSDSHELKMEALC